MYRQSSLNTKILAAFLVALCHGASGKPVALPSERIPGNTGDARPLPEVFVTVLPEVKAKTRIPVLLPAELSGVFTKAKHAVVQKATTSEYTISLYYELGIGDAGFAASFMAKENPKYSPRDLPNVREVKLAAGIGGFFRAVSCGGSCAPANLWWEQGEVSYQIQLELPSNLGEGDQEKTITAVANSAILAGPR